MGAWRLERILAALIILSAGSRAFALDSSNVLVLYNSASTDGSEIASFYAQARPGVHTLGINFGGMTVGENISHDVYLNVIRPQVLSYLGSSPARIDCLVTTKGMPLRIENWPNPNPSAYPNWSRYSSLESELTRIDVINSQVLMGNQAWSLADTSGGNSLAKNPYFYRNEAFNHDLSLYNTMRLTTRLDGFTVADVKASITNAQKAVYYRPGYTFLIDDDPNAPGASADRMYNLANNVIKPRNLSYIYDTTTAFISSVPSPQVLMGYTTHGSYGGAPRDYLSNAEAGLLADEAAGAVFSSWESFNAWTFDQSAIATMPVRQGLIAEWIARGGTAGVGNVQEPLVSIYNVTNEERMWKMLLDGYTFAEAAWNATRQLSWVNTIVGDPLMTFRPWVTGDFDLDGDVDMADLSAVKACYASVYGDSRYNLMADMNGDGKVDFTDLTIVKANYTGPIAKSQTVVPEPATLAMLSFAAVGILARKRR